MKCFILWALFFTGITHSQTADFIDNTNSEGLSSMQRAILKEDIPRMEGLINNGAGYYWAYGDEKPLINYAISNNKPKAVDFLLSRQTVVDYSVVETAMEQSNYTLVKKLIDQKHLRAFESTNLIIENRSPTGRYSNVTEILPYEVYHTNRQFIYTLTNRRREAQSYTLDAGTNSFENPEDYILQYAKAKKQKGGLADFSGNISGVVTNILTKTNVRKEEIINIWTQTDHTNVLLPLELDSTELSGLAQMAVKQNSLPMLQYFIDRGADIHKNNLLHHAVIICNKEMVIYLLGKGVDPLKKSEEKISRRIYYWESFRGTAFGIAASLKKGIPKNIPYLEEDIKAKKSKIVKIQQELQKVGKDSLEYELYTRSLKEQQDSLAESQKTLPIYKKDLPQIIEIYEILKKYEE